MTHQATSRECEGRSPLPVRSLLTCRYDSASTVSTLSLGSLLSAEERASHPASIPRIDRFKASVGSADRGLKAPGRKGSIHKLTTNQNDNHSTLPPRLPSRQDTADRKKNIFAEALKDENEPSSDDDATLRPRLNRASGGINLFSK